MSSKIAIKILQIQRALKMNSCQFARHLGITRMALFSYIKGTYKPKTDVIIRLLQAAEYTKIPLTFNEFGIGDGEKVDEGQNRI